MQTQNFTSRPLDPVEITLLEQELRGQAQAAAAKALARAVRRLVAKVRHGFSSTPEASGLRSA